MTRFRRPIFAELIGGLEAPIDANLMSGICREGLVGRLALPIRMLRKRVLQGGEFYYCF
jgi:hypothetical protein